MKELILRIAFIIGLTLLSTKVAYAHQPALENSNSKIPDPTISSQAVYGSLSETGEVDEYVFTASTNAIIPVEVLVPVRKSNNDFHPYIAIVSENLENGIVFDEATRMLSSITLPPFEIQVGESILVVPPPIINDRDIFYEPFSFESYYSGEEIDLNVVRGQTYKIYVYHPANKIGTYTLGLGDRENFDNANFLTLLGNVFFVKTNHTIVDISWVDIWGTFIMIAGLIIALGSVTVIDLHGFLAQYSKYWTEATIRSHKITKHLIWIGTALHVLGLIILYRQSFLSGVALFQLLIMLILIINGLFLTFVISPKLLKLERNKKIKILPKKLQQKIFISFVISLIGWWSEVFLTVWYLLVLR